MHCLQVIRKFKFIFSYLFIVLLSACIFTKDTGISIPEFQLPLSINSEKTSWKTLNKSNLAGKKTILYFFNLVDCSICLWEMEKWAKAKRELLYFDFNLIGITSTDDASQVEMFCNELQIDFPVYFDENSAFLHDLCNRLNLGSVKTPIKLMFDNQARFKGWEKPRKNVEYTVVRNLLIDFLDKS